MKVFDFDSYKKFVHFKLLESPNKGHGKFSRMAKSLNVHSSLISQIFKGSKHLTVEQACGVCKLFDLTEIETDYFLALVQFDRAGTEDAKKKFQRDLQSLRARSLSLRARTRVDKELTEAEKAIFYSQWYYTAVALLPFINGYGTAQSIAEKLQLDLTLVRQALEFLVANGFCVEKEDKIVGGHAHTYLTDHSPMINRHHMNWRVKAFERINARVGGELYFTMPLTISTTDATLVQKKMVDFLEDIRQLVVKSKSEQLFCLNIDWYNVCPDKSK